MYLTRAAIDATLAAVARRSAPGSRVALTYQRNAGFRSLALVVRVAREPFQTYLESADAHAILAAHGFAVESDTGNPDWAARYLGRAKDDWSVERLAVAIRPIRTSA
jgi:O-methyltransferase involved in polyketide biosynthesis